MISFFFSAAWALQVSVHAPKELEFSVELQDVIVHHLRFSSSVVPGRVFSVEAHNGDVVCTVSGTVPAAVNGVYSFPVKIDESNGPKTSMKSTQMLALSLNKSYSGGPAASFVYMRTFKLSDSGSGR